MQSIALSKPDAASHYLNCQVEHVEIAGVMAVGGLATKKYDVKQIRRA